MCLYRDEIFYLRRTNTKLMEKLVHLWTKCKELIPIDTVNTESPQNLLIQSETNFSNIVDIFNEQVILADLKQIKLINMCVFVCFFPTSVLFASLCDVLHICFHAMPGIVLKIVNAFFLFVICDLYNPINPTTNATPPHTKKNTHTPPN